MMKNAQEKRTLSLKTRLAAGAALLGAGTVLTALILYLGLSEVGKRLDAALDAETRMARYAALSSQAATFLVIATEAVQTGQPPETRIQRITPVTDQMHRSFDQIRAAATRAMQDAEVLGLDAQSRQGTQSLGIARMEALLGSALTGLASDSTDTARMRAYIDGFASNFEPLLSQSVNTELVFRNEILSGIGDLRQRLTLIAAAIALGTLVLVAGFYAGLIRPQLRRLDALRDAAQQIGQERFDIALPVSRQDEIGLLSAETNRMAAALRTRQDAIQTEWARLNDTIAERTGALRAANAALEEIDDNRRRFFADISHELRTPLTVILMEAQIGKKGSPDPEAAFATIESRAARLNRRIDDLLRVARSDSGQLALDPQTTALPDLLDTVVAEIKAETDNAGMTLLIDTPPDVAITCDANWARQVVAGLVRNAITHAREGGRIRLSPEVTETHAGLAVSDNGPGIASQDQTRLFERFEQGTSKAAAQGFGVGLNLARWVVEAQDGIITLTSPLPKDHNSSDSGTGTKISVRFPRAVE
ncbi:MAG: HAMP domain-containing sensor histidine kinase [Sulfitobacter sp.]